MSAILCDIDADDEVILPSYTFVSTANPFHLRNANLRFVDIRNDTLNLDESLIEPAVTRRTKAIVPVHYAGVPCEMDVINDIAKRHNLYVIEDAAQGAEASHKGRPQGALGDIGAFSFHETKNFLCGEGGALVVSDPTMFERAEMVREDGTDRRRFFRGEVDAYSWCTEGSTYAMPDILAAFLYAQLKNMETLTSRRKAIFQLYRQRLEPLAERGLLRLPVIPESGQTNYHMFYIVLECLERRTSYD